MRKIVFIVLSLMLFLMNCSGNTILNGDEVQITSEVPENNRIPNESGNEVTLPPEIPVINDDPDDVWNQKTPPPEIPVVNDYMTDYTVAGDYKSYGVSYVYLTDMSRATPLTLVREGDLFLSWRAENIKVALHEHDDGSISYWSALVEFTGEAEIGAGLEYWGYDSQTHKGGCIIVTIHEESKHLIPNLPNRFSVNHFMIYMEETDERLDEIFSGADGYIIEDCRIVVSNYRIVFAYTDANDTASFVEIKR